MDITTKKVNRKLKEYKTIKKIYKSSFPKTERAPIWLLMHLAKKPYVNSLAYYDSDNFIGITYSIKYENIVYVLYLAVNEEYRSMGYGSKILSWIKETNKDKIIMLDVEAPFDDAPNIEQRLRRIKFYEKNGFINTKLRIDDKQESFIIFSTSLDFELKNYQALWHLFSHGLYKPKITKID